MQQKIYNNKISQFGWELVTCSSFEKGLNKFNTALSKQRVIKQSYKPDAKSAFLAVQWSSTSMT